MHSYLIKEHDRSSIGRYMGVTAIIMASIINQYLNTQFTEIHFLVGASISIAFAYGLLHLLFLKLCWRFSYFDIPNLNGVWKVKGKSISDEGSITHEWEGELRIDQDWKDISIYLKTMLSESSSYIATIFQKRGPSGGWHLAYSYSNEADMTSSGELAHHLGITELIFDRNLRKATGYYANCKGRNTKGSIELWRV